MIGFVEDLGKDRATDTFALIVRVNVQVIEKQLVGLRLDHKEPDPLAAELNERWPRKFRHPDKWKLCFITAGQEPEKAARP